MCFFCFSQRIKENREEKLTKNEKVYENIVNE